MLNFVNSQFYFDSWNKREIERIFDKYIQWSVLYVSVPPTGEPYIATREIHSLSDLIGEGEGYISRCVGGAWHQIVLCGYNGKEEFERQKALILEFSLETYTVEKQEREFVEDRMFGEGYT